MTLTVNYAALDWSNRQKKILTANGRADDYYTAKRGFSFLEEELPHYFLSIGKTDFEELRQRQDVYKPIVGVWNRVLFYGGFDFTTEQDEITYNLQTSTFFIDLRVPRSRASLWNKNHRSLDELDGDKLRLYARQHVFSGFTHMLPSENKDALCIRHHCIDWNYVGTPRSRPNKWYVEMDKSTDNIWKEWAFAKDDDGQYYYCEHWKRRGQLTKNQVQPFFVLRKIRHEQDGLIIIIGDDFNFIIGRDPSLNVMDHEDMAGSLVERVDHLVAKGDFTTAQKYLSMQGGHGIVSKGWIIDLAIEPWREGSSLWTADTMSFRKGDNWNNCVIVWNQDYWHIVDCNLDGEAAVNILEKLLVIHVPRTAHSTSRL